MMQLHSYTYSVPYIIVAFLLLFSYRYELQSYTRKVTIQIIFLFLLFFIGLRGHLLTDFISYYPYFQTVPTINHLSEIFFTNTEYEKGFTIYVSIFKSIIPNYYVWIFFNSLIDLVAITWLFKKYSKSIVLSYIFFFAFAGFSMEVNLIRNMKSIILFFLSIPYLLQNRFFPYLLINLIGITFHTSSLFYIPLYFILNKTFPISILVIVFSIVNILFFLKIDLVNAVVEYLFLQLSGAGGLSKLHLYQETSSESYGFSIGYFERSLAYLLFMIYYKKLIADSPVNRILCNSFFLYYLIFYFFFNVSIFTERIPLLLIYSYWILYPNLLSLIKQYRLQLFLLAFTLCLLKISTRYSSIICRYENWLLGGISSYEERKNIYMSNPELW